MASRPVTDCAAELAPDSVTTLTWYPGSIRPYTSLWHTAMRVAALNGHRAGELPGWPAGLEATGQRHRILHPLHNPWGAFNTEALAHALGESPEVFRWSHLGALPPWLRPLVTPGFRVCLACLADGYHSALFSLRLLRDCPIHKSPLLEHCHCGRPFLDKLTTADLIRRGCCPCGQFTFFTPEACRVPSLAPHQTRVLDAVVHWLEQLACVARCTQWRELAPLASDVAALVGDLSNTLNFVYPDCLHRVTAALSPAARFSYSQTRTGGLLRRTLGYLHSARGPGRTPYWTDTPAFHVYKAVARYLRKHGVRRTDYWGEQFQSLNNGERQRLLDQEPEAMPAWIEWTWAQRIEPDVHIRRWPYRPPWAALADMLLGPLYGQLAPISVHACRHTLCGTSVSTDSPVHTWLQYQAAGFTLLQHWRAASGQAQEGTVQGCGDGRLLPLEQYRCDWSAALQPDDSFLFLGHDPAPGGFPRLPLPNKGAREYALWNAQFRSWGRVLRVCVGPCLTFHTQDGWLVTQAARPTFGHWRRHKLLGLPGAKPSFWLFDAGDGFVARLCDARLQVLGATPKEAITALRKWLPSFQRIQGVATAPDLDKADPRGLVPAGHLT